MVNRNEDAEGFSVGVHLHLQTAVATGKDRFDITIRGWEEGKFVLADMPDEKKSAEIFRIGSEWVARYILSGKAFGFKTHVIKVQFDPKPLVFFRYPESIEALTIRKYKRINIFLIGSIERTAKDGTVQDKVECVIRDLSRGGCLIDTRTNLSAGDKVLASFVLPNGASVDKMPGEVRNVRASGDDHFAGGIMFSEHAEQKRAVDTFFDTVVNEAP
jgi:c-di-GMP-binding flagellar brake protein YcgR